MNYKVVLTYIAEKQLDDILFYLTYVLKNEQAARNVWNDAMDTIGRLESVAGALKECDEPELAQFGYRRINFKFHEYLMLYTIEADTVYIDRIYHRLQDYKNLH
jgi:plasmid stabilization system protein ParE